MPDEHFSYQFSPVSQCVHDRHNLEFDLKLRQQPKQSRMCGVGEKADRRPIDPPPILQLRVVNHSRNPEDHSNITTFLQNPYYFVYASLVAPDSGEELHLLRDGRTRATTGSVVSSLYHLKDIDNTDGGFFVFPDLSVRTEGSYRLKFSLFEIVSGKVYHCRSIYSDPFIVYSAKRFPGMEESTFLSRSFADQGLKIRIRKEVRVRRLSKRRDITQQIRESRFQSSVASLSAGSNYARSYSSHSIEELDDEMTNEETASTAPKPESLALVPHQSKSLAMQSYHQPLPSVRTLSAPNPTSEYGSPLLPLPSTSNTALPRRRFFPPPILTAPHQRGTEVLPDSHSSIYPSRHGTHQHHSHSSSHRHHPYSSHTITQAHQYYYHYQQHRQQQQQQQQQQNRSISAHSASTYYTHSHPAYPHENRYITPDSSAPSSIHRSSLTHSHSSPAPTYMPPPPPPSAAASSSLMWEDSQEGSPIPISARSYNRHSRLSPSSSLGGRGSHGPISAGAVCNPARYSPYEPVYTRRSSSTSFSSLRVRQQLTPPSYGSIQVSMLSSPQTPTTAASSIPTPSTYHDSANPSPRSSYSNYPNHSKHTMAPLYNSPRSAFSYAMESTTDHHTTPEATVRSDTVAAYHPHPHYHHHHHHHHRHHHHLPPHLQGATGPVTASADPHYTNITPLSSTDVLRSSEPSFVHHSLPLPTSHSKSIFPTNTTSQQQHQQQHPYYRQHQHQQQQQQQHSRSTSSSRGISPTDSVTISPIQMKSMDITSDDAITATSSTVA